MRKPKTTDSYTDTSPSKGHKIPITSRYYIILHNLEGLLQELVKNCSYMTASTAILDLGCGHKPYEHLFAQKFSIYVGVDIDRESLADVISRGGYLPFKDGSFDVCLCTQVCEHVRDPELLLMEIHRVLNQRGILFLSTHAIAQVHNYPHDYWRWTDQGLKVLLGKCFPDIQIYEVTTPMETIFQLGMIYLPKNRLSSFLVALVNTLLKRFGKSSLNSRLPKLVSTYLVMARKS